MPLAEDLLHPSPEEEKRKHKKKLMVQSPNFYFMGVKCPGCCKITTVLATHKRSFCVLASPLSSDGQQEEKPGFQKDAPSEGRSTKTTPNQDEWGIISINTFGIQKNKTKQKNSEDRL